MIGYLRLPLSWIAHSDRVGIPLMRVAIAIVFLWIGALKFAPYEADSITPFVANSPFMSFFYEHPAEYKAHLTHEGELKPAERAWQTANNTYGFSDGLGTMEITIGLLMLLAGGLLIMADSARAFLEARPYWWTAQRTPRSQRNI